MHKSKIVNITFNPKGSRMVTSDENGVVGVWRGISCMVQYKKEGPITNSVFCEIKSNINTHNCFFFGGKTGLVCLADD